MRNYHNLMLESKRSSGQIRLSTRRNAAKTLLINTVLICRKKRMPKCNLMGRNPRKTRFEGEKDVAQMRSDTRNEGKRRKDSTTLQTKHY